MPIESKQPGRPTIYTDELANEICERIAGGETLRSVCRDDRMPVVSTVLLWAVRNRSGFSEQYRAAREAQGYSDADRIRELVDMVIDGDIDPPNAKVAIDAYKWTAERNAPKVYGPKQSLDHTSSDGSMTPPRSLADFYSSDDGSKK